MTTAYPEHFEIAIDRRRLEAYLRTQWLISWLLIVGSTGSVGWLVIVLHRNMVWPLPFALVARSLGTGLVLSLILALLLYLITSHPLAARFVGSLELFVEGPFLRVRQRTLAGVTDRKIHFRCIVEYATTQRSSMRRFGLHSLEMTTTAGGLRSKIIVPGVADCLNVRDALAEIDRQRERE